MKILIAICILVITYRIGYHVGAHDCFDYLKMKMDEQKEGNEQK
jgi:hypothetical protein